MNLFKKLFSKKHRHSKLNSLQNSIVNNNYETPAEHICFTTSNIYKFDNQMIENEIYVVNCDEILTLGTDGIIGGKQFSKDRPIIDESLIELEQDFEHRNNPPLQTKQYKIPVNINDKIPNNIDNEIQISADSDDYINVNETETNSDPVLPEKNKIISGLNLTKCNLDTVTGVEDILNMIIKELNKIIIEREDLRKQLILKSNSYKLIKKKFNTILTNRFYKPIRLY